MPQSIYIDQAMAYQMQQQHLQQKDLQLDNLQHFLGANLITNRFGCAKPGRRGGAMPSGVVSGSPQMFAEPLLMNVTGTPLINWRYNRHFGRQRGFYCQGYQTDDVFYPASGQEYENAFPALNQPSTSMDLASFGYLPTAVAHKSASYQPVQFCTPYLPQFVTAYAPTGYGHYKLEASPKSCSSPRHSSLPLRNNNANQDVGANSNGQPGLSKCHSAVPTRAQPANAHCDATCACKLSEFGCAEPSSSSADDAGGSKAKSSVGGDSTDSEKPRVAHFNYAQFLASRKLQQQAASNCVGRAGRCCVHRCQNAFANDSSSSSSEETTTSQSGGKASNLKGSQDSGIHTSDDGRRSYCAGTRRRRRRNRASSSEMPPRFQHSPAAHTACCICPVCSCVPGCHNGLQFQSTSKPRIIFVPNIPSQTTKSMSLGCYDSPPIQMGACSCAECSYRHAPPSYCFLSIIRDKSAPQRGNSVGDDETSSLEDGRCSSSSPNAAKRFSKSHGHIPVITISVPPNCRIIRDDDSVRLSTSFSSSSESLFPADDQDDELDDASSVISDTEDHDCVVSSRPQLPLQRFNMVQRFTASYRRASYPFSVPANASPPPVRPWISITPETKDLPSFTVLCYNVLCDKYASPNLYSYCPSWALSWDYRKKFIMEEIKSSEADIVTLQEVETEQYNQLFNPELSALGYEGIFSPKSRAKTMMEEEKKRVDGCAIFWKSKKFAFEQEHLVEFTRLAIAKAEGSDNMLNRVMTRDNIALAAVLSVRSDIYSGGKQQPTNEAMSVVGEPLVVCTAHIHWDPEFCDVKLVQSMMLVQELQSILEKTSELWATKSPGADVAAKEIPFLVCGDLNSLPESGVFEYLTTGSISTTHKDLKEFRGDICLNKLNACNVAKDCFVHSLGLESAYDPGVMPFTNYTYDFKGIIDYVFGSKANLLRLGVLGPLDPNWFSEHKILGCPHPQVPSDHIPLLVQYSLLPRHLRGCARNNATAETTGTGEGNKENSSI